MELIEELKQLMLEVGVEPAVVEQLDPSRLLAQQGVDSLDGPAFVMAVERRYGINISDADALRLKTLENFADRIGAGR
ncbi:acyl carrier protein [Pelobacter propionicus]|uniref:Phosphopantetheine-binding protein n=1 Tax=Pelobacter propionicus (strain DSM 2379 / NBRC 103807 / OttBd1) TaxID=338966 RepID=A1AP68_PELPD|nr:phosphopantetheine-binding protein [Pelobacter propionicus]ABK99138.1 phosphopantetheine-binding protein [Pelobacter propionicus DSM 2379]